MAEYRLSTAAQAALKRRLLRSGLPLSLLAVGIGIGVGFVRGANVAGVALAIPLALAALAIGMWTSYRRQREQLASFVITIAETSVTRAMLGVPVLTLPRDQIRRIEEHPSGELTLHALRPADSIRIPAEIENRAALLAELSAWAPIERGTAVRSQLWSLVASVGVVAAFAVVMIAEDARIVVPLGLALAIALLACAVLLWRNRQLDGRVRRLAFIIILPTLAILARVIAAIRVLSF